MGIFTVNYWTNIRGELGKSLKTLARLARFERATAWFVARRTSLIPQHLTPSLYGEKAATGPKYSITCDSLRGISIPQDTTPPGCFFVLGKNRRSPRKYWLSAIPARLKFCAVSTCSGDLHTGCAV